MNFKKIFMAAAILWLGWTIPVGALERVPTAEELKVASLETYVILPAALTRIDMWVPADRMGPFFIQCAFRKGGGTCQCRLEGGVWHTRQDSCPEGVARILGELIEFNGQENLPLTRVNEWKWDFPSRVAQYETFSYELVGRDAWENSVEAVLTQVRGVIQGGWLPVEFSGSVPTLDIRTEGQSEIELRTFSRIRSRAGYPKQRSVEVVQ